MIAKEYDALDPSRERIAIKDDGNVAIRILLVDAARGSVVTLEESRNLTSTSYVSHPTQAGSGPVVHVLFYELVSLQ